MKKIVPLPSFERSLKKLTAHEKELLTRSLEAFNEFVLSSKASFGFRFKKINHDKYEFRVDIRLRVVVKETDDAFYLVLVGDHDSIRKYLKNFR